MEKNVKIGNGTKIWHYTNLFDCKIGDNCVIGSYTEIGQGVKIGNNCKIEAYVFIPKGVTIEDNVFIGPHVVFINDKNPKATGEWVLRKTLVKKGASIGSNSTIICGVTIGENSLVGAGSVVTKDVPPNTVVVGNPAKVMKVRTEDE